jgi:hypothetical protein
MTPSTLRRYAGALLLACLLASPAARADGSDADSAQIAHLMHHMFDRPDAPLVIDPIVTVDGYAIAGWTQGDMGGRALLRKSDGAWQVVLCSGDGLKDETVLLQAGIADPTAKQLSQRLADAEHSLDPARLAQLARFEGIVMMDGSGAHPPQAIGHASGS